MSNALEWVLTIFEVLQALDGMDTHAARHSKSYWQTQGKSIVEMRLCGDELCGYLVSEQDTGNPAVSACGLPILLGLKPTNALNWSSGWIVDPDTGWAYNAKAKFNAKGKLKITAYDKAEMFGETLKWRQVTKQEASCYHKKKSKNAKQTK